MKFETIKYIILKHFKLLLTVFAIFSITFSYSQIPSNSADLKINRAKLKPLQKNVYDHFNLSKWTYSTMDNLYPLKMVENGKVKRDKTKLIVEYSIFLSKNEITEAFKTIHNRGGFYDRLKWSKLSPVKKKMYDHFMTDNWTFEKMTKLRDSDKFFPEFLTFLEKSEVKEAYLFYTSLQIEKRIQQSNKRTRELLGPSKGDK